MSVLSKGIILAGGSGSRLFPMTHGISKQLLPVYDKPMIYYPLSILMELGIREILIIVNPENYNNYTELFKNSSRLGLKIKYKVQEKPEGIAQSFLIAENFIGKDNICLILGDNIFYGKNLMISLKQGIENLRENFSSIVGVDIDKPNDFGVIEFDKNNKMSSIIEKPEKHISNTIVSGLYFYNNDVIKYAKQLSPSERGELEITDINNRFLKNNKLKLIILEKEVSWIDTGTFGALIKASKFFQELESKTGFKAACIEEISYRLKYIDRSELFLIAKSMNKSDYGIYLSNIIKK